MVVETAVDTGEVSPRTNFQEQTYPEELRTVEEGLIARRREIARSPTTTHRIGIACSGGGIRSATTCLGFFQALAQVGQLPRVDYISTVSGGGYFGSFLGALYERGKSEDVPADSAQCTVVADLLTNPRSRTIEWLRENGRYIAPKGPADYANIVGIYVRNWLGLHFVVGITLLTIVLLLLSLQALLYRFAPAASEVIHGLDTDFIFPVHWSPYAALLLISLVFGFFPCAWAFWFTQYSEQPALVPAPARRNYSLYASLMVLLVVATAESRYSAIGDVIRNLLGWRVEAILLVGCLAVLYWIVVELQVTFSKAPVHSLQERMSRVRNDLSTALTFSVKAVAVTGALTVIDTIALALSTVHASSVSLSVAAAVAAIYRLAPLLARGRAIRTKISESAIASAIGFALLTMVAVGWDLFGSWLTNACDYWLQGVFNPPSAWLLLGPVLVISLINGQTLTFINLSSLQLFYSARLRRAYLGASNPNRAIEDESLSVQQRERTSNKQSVTREVSGDEIPWDRYAPHLKGGPLHLIAVTVNHTMQSESQLETQDRKGILMAVGPAGVSVGTTSHAVRKNGMLAPVSTPGAQSIFSGLTPTPLACEVPSLSRWMAISGAAFSTGLGARTKSGVSVLLGTANIRLGYWWASGAAKDCSPTVLRSIFRTQAYLYEEFLGRFPGATQKHWYLSDGGHSENTGAYELIRRRIKVIILLDNGADPVYQFEDLGNLIRRVRIDFGVEVKEISFAEAISNGPLKKISDIAPGFTGSLEDVRKSAEPKNGLKVSKAFVSAFRVCYPETDASSILIVVKPTVLGDEPADIVEYAVTHALFPQEPTSDQFFDEAQWESYRRLGYEMGSKLFQAIAF